MSEYLDVANSHVAAIANAMPDPIFIMGQDGSYLDVLGGKERALYADGHSLIGKSFQQVLPKRIGERFLNIVKKSINTNSLQEIEYQLADAEVAGIESERPNEGQWYEARIYPIESDVYGQPAVIWMAINITNRKQMEKQIEHLSSKDTLTDVYNRDHILSIVEDEVEKAHSNHQSLSIAKINLDCFKRITNAFGYEMGDQAILTAAAAIREVVGETGYIGRLSCDQFMFILPGINAEQAFEITQKAQETISSQTIKLEENETSCLSSQAGITEIREAEDDSQTLFKRVNKAIKALEGTREITKTI